MPAPCPEGSNLPPPELLLDPGLLPALSRGCSACPGWAPRAVPLGSLQSPPTVLGSPGWLFWGVWAAVPMEVAVVVCPQGLSHTDCETGVHPPLSLLRSSPGPFPVPWAILTVSVAFWEPHLSSCCPRCPFPVSCDRAEPNSP